MHCAPALRRYYRCASPSQPPSCGGEHDLVGCCQGLKKSDIADEYEFKKLYPEDREWINKGNSCVVNPKGEIIAGPLEASQEIIYSDLDLEITLESKWMFDAAGHYNRPDVFDFSVRA